MKTAMTAALWFLAAVGVASAPSAIAFLVLVVRAAFRPYLPDGPLSDDDIPPAIAIPARLELEEAKP